jgi:hypothetical protein
VFYVNTKEIRKVEKEKRKEERRRRRKAVG